MRPARPEDRAAAARAHLEAFRATYRGILAEAFLEHLEEPRFPAKFDRALADPRSLALVAEDGGRVVGVGYAGPSREPGYPGGEVYAIYLLPEAQGRGLGRALFEEALRFLKETGQTPVWVWVIETNERARGFYRQMGGVKAGVRVSRLPDPEGRPVRLVAYRF